LYARQSATKIDEANVCPFFSLSLSPSTPLAQPEFASVAETMADWKTWKLKSKEKADNGLFVL
jgi:hypothetical protein